MLLLIFDSRWGANKVLYHRTDTRRMDLNIIMPIVEDVWIFTLRRVKGWSIGSIQKQ